MGWLGDIEEWLKNQQGQSGVLGEGSDVPGFMAAQAAAPKAPPSLPPSMPAQSMQASSPLGQSSEGADIPSFMSQPSPEQPNMQGAAPAAGGAAKKFPSFLPMILKLLAPTVTGAVLGAKAPQGSLGGALYGLTSGLAGHEVGKLQSKKLDEATAKANAQNNMAMASLDLKNRQFDATKPLTAAKTALYNSAAGDKSNPPLVGSEAILEQVLNQNGGRVPQIRDENGQMVTDRAKLREQFQGAFKAQNPSKDPGLNSPMFGIGNDQIDPLIQSLEGYASSGVRRKNAPNRGAIGSSPMGKPSAQPSSGGMIRVRLQDGQTGMISSDKFDPNTMTKL